jgi:N-acetylneuraminate synthase
MILDKAIEKYVIHQDSPVSRAVAKIAEHKGRVLFGVDHHNHLTGALTNGDLIRWLTTCGQTADLGASVASVLNKNYRYHLMGEAVEKVSELLSDFLFVPVVDEQHHLVAVARRRTAKDDVLVIDGRRVSEQDPVYIIAEIGNNHNGSLERAKRLIDAAVNAGADCAKFQMRDIETLYKNSGDAGDAAENLGSQYTLDLLSRFQLDTDDMFAAFDYCKEKGITPLCTPWDERSVQHLENYGLSAYKVASADLTNHELIKTLAATGKPLILSTGMSRENEIQQAVELLRWEGVQYALLHCNSTYPPPFRDINLGYMARLKEIGQTLIGYSGHERDIFVVMAAVAQGARIIEKHFTEDRSLEGNDHKVSLLPDEFARLVEGVRQVDESMGGTAARSMSQGELMNRVTLAKSIYVNQDLAKGDVVEEKMLIVNSPGQGIQPNRKNDLIGRVIQRSMKAGDVFYESDLLDKVEVHARGYRFNRPWGLPVRYHDYARLMKKTNPDLLEFHLSYKDMELDLTAFFKRPLDLDLVVHSPELFAGDHTLDLCSKDEAYRARSISELQRVITITRELAGFFRKSERIGIVTNVGGFTESAPLHGKEQKHLIALLVDSLQHLDTEGVEIWPQTMPPYPWHFGGQRYHNLFVDADEIVEFCQTHGYRICLDLSHSKLAMNHRQQSFTRFTEQVAPHVAHLHVADAGGLDGEGLQIGDGEIDFVSIGRVLDKLAPGASMIPEIWQGHENEGEGFWLALERLESFWNTH